MRPPTSPLPRQPAGQVARERSPRRRDRRGRGLRGPLAPREVPISRTRAQRFHDLVEKSVARLELRWARELAEVEFAVADVPPRPRAVSAGSSAGPEAVRLARTFTPHGSSSPHIVVYRRPLEARAADLEDLESLVHDVIVEEVADLLGLAPEAVDPRYGDGFDDEEDDEEP